MQGNQDVVSILNDALTAELTAVNQYFISAKLAAHWGYATLAAEYRSESIEEMKHAELLIDRILFLDGVPNMQRLSPVKVGETVVEQFTLNREGEVYAVDLYRRGVAVCEAAGDPGSRIVFETLLRDEEHHLDEADAELTNLEQVGEALWLSKWA